MSNPKVRFIVEKTAATWGGNTYAFAVVTSTLTGKSIALETCGARSPRWPRDTQ